MADYELVMKTHIGARSENQDIMGSRRTRLGLLVVVCDGMGGAPGGRLAAHTACQEVLEGFAHPEQDASLELNRLNQLIQQANFRVYELGREHRALKGLGTTLAALLIQEEQAFFIHAGDTRIYQLRHSGILHKTRDHSLVGDRVRRGIWNEEQARLSFQSHILTRCLGISPRLEPEAMGGLDFSPGDRFLVCTDGVWGAMPEDELAIQCSLPGPLDPLATKLLERIYQEGLASGGGSPDNMTLGLLEIKQTGKDL